MTTATSLGSSPPPRAFVAFAGGGAKGLAHVGALRALESRVEVVGYAGTSAGAIVATLAAAGLTADEIVHPSSGRTVLDELRAMRPAIKDLTDLFGPGAWRRIAIARDIKEVLGDLAWPSWVWGSLAMSTAAAPLLTSAVAGSRGDRHTRWAVPAAWLLAAGLLSFGVGKLGSGLARLTTLRDTLDAYLTFKLRGPGGTEPVRMNDFDGRSGRPLLKIVAADITHQRMTVFSCDHTPEVRVADAVAASVCLPFIFEPWPIPPSRFIDGGVVSNFPAWPFDEERLLDADAVTIGFEIGAPPEPRAPRRGRPRPSRRPNAPGLPLAVLQTALTGAAELSTRAVGRAELLTLHPDLDLLDFDISSYEVRAEIAAIAEAAAADLELRFTTYPSTYRSACEQVRDEVAAALLSGFGRGERVRCAVAMRARGFRHSLLTLYGVGYNQDPDFDLAHPDDSSLAGRAWRCLGAQFELDPIGRGVELQRPQDVALRRRQAPGLAWSLRVPVLTRADRRFLVVLVDGWAHLADDDGTARVFKALVDRVETIFRPVVDAFEDTVPNG